MTRTSNTQKCYEYSDSASILVKIAKTTHSHTLRFLAHLILSKDSSYTESFPLRLTIAKHLTTTMPRTLTPISQDAITDWNGITLSSQAVRHLFPSCVVRVVIQNPNTKCAEAVYFEITKIKDGTFWGIARDTYRLSDWIGLEEGQQMTFRKEHINEIPIDWQPKAYQKAVRGLAAQAKGRGTGYAITGCRGTAV